MGKCVSIQNIKVRLNLSYLQIKTATPLHVLTTQTNILERFGQKKEAQNKKVLNARKLTGWRVLLTLVNYAFFGSVWPFSLYVGAFLSANLLFFF